MEIVRGDFKKNPSEIKESLIPEAEFIAMNVVKPEDDVEDFRPVVLHVALEAPTYSSHGISEGFRRNGYRVEFFNWQAIKIELGVGAMLERMETKARMDKPDLIFLHIQSPDILDIAACKVLTAIAPTVLYTFDCRDKEKTQWMYDLAPHLTLVLFSNMEDVSYCISQGITNVGVMQSSADIDLYRPVDMSAYSQGDRVLAPVVFVGGDYSKSNMNFPKAEERKKMVEFLLENFTAGKSPNGDIFFSYGMGQMANRYIHQQEEVLIYNSAKIAINQSNYARGMYTSDRIWRIMASGCFCLTEYFEGIESMFKIGIHLDTWKTLDELKEKINYYLSHPALRGIIASDGCDYVRNHHSWQKRFEIFSELIKSK